MPRWTSDREQIADPHRAEWHVAAQAETPIHRGSPLVAGNVGTEVDQGPVASPNSVSEKWPKVGRVAIREPIRHTVRTQVRGPDGKAESPNTSADPHREPAVLLTLDDIDAQRNPMAALVA